RIFAIALLLSSSSAAARRARRALPRSGTSAGSKAGAPPRPGSTGSGPAARSRPRSTRSAGTSRCRASSPSHPPSGPRRGRARPQLLDFDQQAAEFGRRQPAPSDDPQVRRVVPHVLDAADAADLIADLGPVSEPLGESGPEARVDRRVERLLQ